MPVAPGGLAGLRSGPNFMSALAFPVSPAAISPVDSLANSLADVLARPDVWRGDALAQAAVPGLPSGYPELDRELPGGGWPRQALSEFLADAGAGVAGLLAPALATAPGGVLLVAPPQPLHAPGWAAAGLAPARLLIVEARGQDAAWACEMALGEGGFAAILAWLPEIDSRSLRRLQLAAEGFGGPAFVVRPPARAREASPAPLRLALESRPEGLQLSLLKRRGGAMPRPLVLLPRLAVARLLERDRALARPAFSPAAPGRSGTASRPVANSALV